MLRLYDKARWIPTWSSTLVDLHVLGGLVRLNRYYGNVTMFNVKSYHHNVKPIGRSPMQLKHLAYCNP